MANEFIAKKGLGIGNLVSTLLKVNASGIVVAATAGTDYQAPITNPTTGTGTTNYVTKWTGATTLGNSTIFDNGNVGIGTTSPAYKLDVNGTLGVTGAATFSSLAGTGTRVVEASSAGLLSATKIVDAGTYTPTYTNISGTSAVTASTASYTRVGNIITVSGYVEGNCTSGVDISFDLTLPISSNFTSEYQLNGNASASMSGGNDNGFIKADTTTDKARFFNFSIGTAFGFHYVYQYQIL